MNRNAITTSIHVVCWIFIFFSPLMFANRTEGFNWSEFLTGCSMPAVLCLIFYTNYLHLVPKFLINNKKQKAFYLSNTLMIIVFAFLLHYIMAACMPHKAMHNGETPPPEVYFIIRDIITLIVIAGMATAIRLSIQWGKAEEARKEAEIEKTDAELKNLRNQINPHFLLNTLNNIYALIAFNTEKAQTAVLELSKLLRHILYDNNQPTVNLSDEATFISNYINLMRIRLQDNVKVDVNINIPNPCTKQVAPLIFISLIENAFKHGVSVSQPSFISINLNADESKIECLIENSNYPKTPKDKSGHGIGLEQVGKRLELSYPGHYEWTKGISEDKQIYTSKIIIYDTKLCNC
jgi:sensor histidine kinase YesM